MPEALLLAIGAGVNTPDTLEVGCGRCGGRFQVPVAGLAQRITFDCPRCRRTIELSRRTLERVLSAFSQEERLILIRMAAGFPASDVARTFGKSTADIEELRARLTRQLAEESSLDYM